MDKKEHRKTIPCDDQPATQTGELVKRLITAYNQPFTIVTHGDYPLSAKDIIQLLGDAAARLEELKNQIADLQEILHFGCQDRTLISVIGKAMENKRAALGEEVK